MFVVGHSFIRSLDRLLAPLICLLAPRYSLRSLVRLLAYYSLLRPWDSGIFASSFPEKSWITVPASLRRVFVPLSFCFSLPSTFRKEWEIGFHVVCNGRTLGEKLKIVYNARGCWKIVNYWTIIVNYWNCQFIDLLTEWLVPLRF